MSEVALEAADATVLDQVDESSWAAYPEYKDTGVEWLGRVPSHWNVSPAKLLIKLRNGFPFSSESFQSNGAPEDRLVRIRDILGTENPLYTDENCPLPARIYNGDVLIGMDGDFNVVEWQEGPAKLNQRVCAVNGISPEWNRYFYYLIQIPLKIVNDLTFSTTVKHLSSGQILKQNVPVPPEGEVGVIVSFLDRETARIDALIAKKQQLIDLLQEKRTALISQAVTKGLDPGVSMKDSGVEWLGEIPAHWKTTKLKFETKKIVDGTHFTPTYVDEGVPFLRVTDIHGGTIDWASVKRIPVEEHQELVKRCKPERHDLLLSKNGTIGVPCVVDWDDEFSIFVSLCLLKFREKLRVQYAKYFFFSHQISEQITCGSKKNTVINLHLDKIKEFVFSLPPVDEQDAIVTFLDENTSRIDKLVAKISMGINGLVEYRSALISAAVTGKIDVRQGG